MSVDVVGVVEVSVVSDDVEVLMRMRTNNVMISPLTLMLKYQI